MVNPYASPVDSQSSRPAKSRILLILRMVGLTICFFLGGISTLIGFALFFNVIYRHAPDSGVFDDGSIVLGLAPFLGFGLAWLLAGVLFVLNRQIWGWGAIAMGIAIPMILNWLNVP